MTLQEVILIRLAEIDELRQKEEERTKKLKKLQEEIKGEVQLDFEF